ncbi:unnamed protein product [Polarella glacialis]|uniref:Uncharacterized protein n=1 Tax=Polarella glacialis TaxID=89957 RepID=A0A813FRL7_POLGL|nr:unnamed protein product [Polarella glacialis]
MQRLQERLWPRQSFEDPEPVPSSDVRRADVVQTPGGPGDDPALRPTSASGVEDPSPSDREEPASEDAAPAASGVLEQPDADVTDVHVVTADAVACDRPVIAASKPVEVNTPGSPLKVGPQLVQEIEATALFVQQILESAKLVESGKAIQPGASLLSVAPLTRQQEDDALQTLLPPRPSTKASELIECAQTSEHQT